MNPIEIIYSDSSFVFGYTKPLFVIHILILLYFISFGVLILIELFDSIINLWVLWILELVLGAVFIFCFQLPALTQFLRSNVRIIAFKETRQPSTISGAPFQREMIFAQLFSILFGLINCSVQFLYLLEFHPTCCVLFVPNVLAPLEWRTFIGTYIISFLTNLLGIMIISRAIVCNMYPILSTNDIDDILLPINNSSSRNSSRVILKNKRP